MSFISRRRRNRQLLVPEAREEMDRLKAWVLKQQTGKQVQGPVDAKMEMARQAGVSYRPGGSNGDMKTSEAVRWVDHGSANGERTGSNGPRRTDPSKVNVDGPLKGAVLGSWKKV